MDWSQWGTDYIAMLEAVTYYATLVLWVLIPFAGIGFLAYAICRCGQSFALKAEKRKFDKFHLQMENYLKKEDHNG